MIKKLPKTGSRRNITTTCTVVQAVPSYSRRTSYVPVSPKSVLGFKNCRGSKIALPTLWLYNSLSRKWLIMTMMMIMIMMKHITTYCQSSYPSVLTRLRAAAAANQSPWLFSPTPHTGYQPLEYVPCSIKKVDTWFVIPVTLEWLSKIFHWKI